MLSQKKGKPEQQLTWPFPTLQLEASTTVVKLQPRLKAMAPLVQRLLYKHEDLSLDPWHPPEPSRALQQASVALGLDNGAT